MDEATSKQFLKRIEALPKNATLTFRKQWVLKQSTPLALMDKIIQQIQTAIELSPSTSVDEKRKAATAYAAESFWGGFDPPPARMMGWIVALVS
jgi:hypothetical protein